MNATAERYMTEIVDPTIGDFEANPTSVRHAFLACVVTYHSIDYLTHPTKPASRRKKFRAVSPEFAIVDRVAHAFKHVETGHAKSLNHQPLKADDVFERPPARCGQMRCGLSRLGDTSGGVTINSETNHDLLRTVKKAAEFLRAKAAG
jgi:hypothetical protein